jgi:hypothetical protein
MSLEGPLLVVAEKPAGGLVKALTDAGAFPVVEARWAQAGAAATEIKPSAVVVCEPDANDNDAVSTMCRQLSAAKPIVPIIVRLRENQALTLHQALPIAEDAPVEEIITRLVASLRLRVLHATVLGRARVLKAERNVVAELPAADPLDDATVLLVGRGRFHPTLSVAVGERMGVMGALSVDTAARCLAAREVDGVLIGDGLPSAAVNAFLALLAEDARLRHLPVGLLGCGGKAPGLSNFVNAGDPLFLLARAIPLIRFRALESALKRLLHSIETKGMTDARTDLLNIDAFGRELGRAIEDANERGVGLSLARLTFEPGIDRRTSLDAARLISRLVRDADFACRQNDGSILFVFADTGLRAAHVAARRLASVLKHTMLQPDRNRPAVSPDVMLASLKPSDSVLTLLARVSPRPVAAS